MGLTVLTLPTSHRVDPFHGQAREYDVKPIEVEAI